MNLLHHSAFNPWRNIDRVLGAPSNEPAWTPAFDISETETAYVLRGDIPGVPQKDIEVRVEDGVLTVRGERKRQDASVRYSRNERRYGKFVRRFRLGDTVDTERVKASYVDGVLELPLPKQEPEDTSRLIPVQ